jgi:tetratricopeptide (TPR) repeat protein
MSMSDPATPQAVGAVLTSPRFERRSVESIYATGHFLFQQERFSEAAAVFRLMLYVAPTDERAWLALGECHARSNQKRIALELYSAGSVAAAPAPRCTLARARLLAELGRTAEADAAYESARNSAELSDDGELMGIIAREGKLQ